MGKGKDKDWYKVTNLSPHGLSLGGLSNAIVLAPGASTIVSVPKEDEDHKYSLHLRRVDLIPADDDKEEETDG